jgi:hypothetical protein
VKISSTVEEFMGNQNDLREENRRKFYEKPTVRQLTPEEAKLKLIALASHGDEEAKAMLEMMFPEEAKKLSTDKKKTA